MDNKEMNENNESTVDSVDKSSIDADVVAEQSNSQTMKDRLLSTDHWLRFVFMVLFAVIACVASYVVAILIVIQFVFALVTGGDNGETSQKLRDFGGSLSQYLFQILKFLTYNSEEKPFPFADWPQTEDKD